MRAVCPQCGCRFGIRVPFDRDCSLTEQSKGGADQEGQPHGGFYG